MASGGYVGNKLIWQVAKSNTFASKLATEPLAQPAEPEAEVPSAGSLHTAGPREQSFCPTLAHYWHMSACKNAAAIFALLTLARKHHSDSWLEVFRNTLIIHLSVDNVMQPGFIQSWWEKAQRLRDKIEQQHDKVMMPPVVSDRQFGFGDRMAVWASDFLLIGGFDQEPGILGAGGETADLQNRLFHMSKLKVNTLSDNWLKEDCRFGSGLGVALPNTFPEINLSSDRNWCKIANFDLTQ